MYPSIVTELVRMELRDSNDRPRIWGRDLTDTYNEESFYTENVRGLNKAWLVLMDEARKNPQGFKMWDAVRLLDGLKLKCHVYCAMD